MTRRVSKHERPLTKEKFIKAMEELHGGEDVLVTVPVFENQGEDKLTIYETDSEDQQDEVVGYVCIWASLARQCVELNYGSRTLVRYVGESPGEAQKLWAATINNAKPSQHN